MILNQKNKLLLILVVLFNTTCIVGTADVIFTITAVPPESYLFPTKNIVNVSEQLGIDMWFQPSGSITGLSTNFTYDSTKVKPLFSLATYELFNSTDGTSVYIREMNGSNVNISYMQSNDTETPRKVGAFFHSRIGFTAIGTGIAHFNITGADARYVFTHVVPAIRHNATVLIT